MVLNSKWSDKYYICNNTRKPEYTEKATVSDKLLPKIRSSTPCHGRIVLTNISGDIHRHCCSERGSC